MNKCDLKEPHSHLVFGKTFECEKGMVECACKKQGKPLPEWYKHSEHICKWDYRYEKISDFSNRQLLGFIILIMLLIAVIFI